jgi:xylulokinase
LIYGLEILQEIGVESDVIKTSPNNLFQSEVFAQTFADLSGLPLEFYFTDGAVGAARAAGVGAGIYNSHHEAFEGLKLVKSLEPRQNSSLKESYRDWKSVLQKQLSSNT